MKYLMKALPFAVASLLLASYASAAGHDQLYFVVPTAKGIIVLGRALPPAHASASKPAAAGKPTPAEHGQTLEQATVGKLNRGKGDKNLKAWMNKLHIAQLPTSAVVTASDVMVKIRKQIERTAFAHEKNPFAAIKDGFIYELDNGVGHAYKPNAKVGALFKKMAKAEPGSRNFKNVTTALAQYGTGDYKSAGAYSGTVSSATKSFLDSPDVAAIRVAGALMYAGVPGVNVDPGAVDADGLGDFFKNLFKGPQGIPGGYKNFTDVSHTGVENAQAAGSANVGTTVGGFVTFNWSGNSVGVKDVGLSVNGTKTPGAPVNQDLDLNNQAPSGPAQDDVTVNPDGSMTFSGPSYPSGPVTIGKDVDNSNNNSNSNNSNSNSNTSSGNNGNSGTGPDPTPPSDPPAGDPPAPTPDDPPGPPPSSGRPSDDDTGRCTGHCGNNMPSPDDDGSGGPRAFVSFAGDKLAGLALMQGWRLAAQLGTVNLRAVPGLIPLGTNNNAAALKTVQSKNNANIYTFTPSNQKVITNTKTTTNANVKANVNVNAKAVP